MDPENQPASTTATNLSPKAIWISLAIAAAIPVLAIISLIVLAVVTNFNVMDWME